MLTDRQKEEFQEEKRIDEIEEEEEVQLDDILLEDFELDDILAEEGNSEITGKPVGNDKELGKCTYVSYYGLEGAKQELNKITDEAILVLKEYGEKAEFLRQLAVYIRDRQK